MATNVFDLFAKISLDSSGYEKGLSSAKDKFSKVADGIKTGVSTIAKVTAGAVATGTAAVGALAKSSLDSYASYEQLVGGVETLFKDSADEVKKYADNAYKTAGMSANDYMDTAIQFSASLINSLDGNTEKAAKQVDKAITDMSDNVNKMGTSVESVQNAYRGFSRGNFTMLDNLSLGFAGTKEGMQQLLDKAHELSGIEYDIESYSDIVDAIHEVQVSMGITGTTAKEAAGTIEGSTASMKAAWHNLLIELGKEDGNVGGAFSVLFGSAKTNLSNTLPRVKQIARGIGQLSVTILAEIKKSLKENSSEDNNILTDLIDIAREYFPAIRHFAGDIVTQLRDDLKDKVDNIDFKSVGEKASEFIKTGLSKISGFIDNLDSGEWGDKLGDFLNGIDWKGIIDGVFDTVKATLKIGGNFLSRLVSSLEPEEVAVATGFLFAKRLISGISDNLSSPSGEIKTNIDSTKLTLGSLFKDIGSEGGASFSTAFSAALTSFMAGYSFGSWIYSKYGEQIDSAVWGIFDNIKAVMNGEEEEITYGGDLFSDPIATQRAFRARPTLKNLERAMNANDWDISDISNYTIDKFNSGDIDAKQLNEMMQTINNFIANGGKTEINLNMNGQVFSDDADTFMEKITSKLSERLERLRTKQGRMAGGAGY